MLTLTQLTVRRGAQTLQYDDLTVVEGTLLTIQGESGAGKSTLLDLVAGFMTPHSGAICWHGESLMPLSVQQRPVSMLFQSHNLFQHLSLAQNLHLALHSWPVAQREQMINAATQTLGVYDLLQRRPGQLSGGQQQRMALIRTLLRPEPLVLLDEPFTGLDDKHRMACADWVRAQVDQGGKTVLLVTHQDDDVVRIADNNVRL